MYVAPYIDATGLHIPSYSDILGDMVSEIKNIYGQDTYLGNDSQDYQLLSIYASKTYDVMLQLQAVYNGQSPSTAIGVSLDRLIKINGLQRLIPTWSTCIVTLTGITGAQINGGVVQDINNNKWDLPLFVVIGVGGTMDVTATCSKSGPITASPGDINSIVTPTYGWVSVTNSGSAIPGTDFEADSALRSRQAISTALPSKSIIEGTEGAIAAILGVTRLKIYENDQTSLAGYEVSGLNPSTNISAGPGTKFEIVADVDATYHPITLVLTGLTTGAAIATAIQTAIRALGGIYAAVTVVYTTVYTITSGTTGINSTLRIKAGATLDVTAALKLGANGATDVNGWPGHSITCIVEGGDDGDVADVIWGHKGPGCLANGLTITTITDAWGLTTIIGFGRPISVNIDVVVNVKQLQGYTTAITTAIKAAVAAYLSGISLGTKAVYISSLWGAALSAQTLISPIFSVMGITAARHSGTQGTSDITLAYNEASHGDVVNVTVNVT